MNGAGLDTLIRALGLGGLDFSAEDLLDALWLAPRLPWRTDSLDDLRQAMESGTPTSQTSPPTKGADRLPPPDDRRGVVPPPGSTPEEGVDVHLPGPATVPGGGPQGVLVRLPDAARLPDALAMARALRPLRRRQVTTRFFGLDEPRTAERIAAGDIWLPVLVPGEERWLSVALVVDVGASMPIWENMLGDFQHLLETLGAFRNVQRWWLDTEDPAWKPEPDGLTPLFASQVSHSYRRPLDVVDPSGRRLILVVSDCVSDAWWDGRVERLLRLWGRCNHTAIVQILPHNMWERTALGPAEEILLRSPRAACPNAHLRAFSRTRLRGLQGVLRPSAVSLPVLNLDAATLGEWSQWVAQDAGGMLPGRLFEPGVADTEATEGDAWMHGIGQPFLSLASRPARKLANIMAVAPPFNLPLLRVIRESMLEGEATQIHEAEFLLGGLVKIVAGNDLRVRRPDEVLYDFRSQELRRTLRAAVRIPDALSLLRIERVSRYLGHWLGRQHDFPAYLASPDDYEGALPLGSIANHDPIARFTSDILQWFGEPYAGLLRAGRRGAVHVETAGGVATATPGTSKFADAAERVAPIALKAAKVRPAHWILVAGSASATLVAAQAGEALGRELARAGFGLVSGGQTGVDAHVIEALTRVATESGRSVEELLVQVVPPSYPPGYPGGRILTVPSRAEWSTKLVELCSAVVLIEGGQGTRKVVEAAVRAGKPVLPLGGTGGYAGRLHDRMLRDWESSHVPGVTTDDFRRLNDPAPAATAHVVTLLQRLFAGGEGQEPPAARPGPTMWVLIAGLGKYDLPPQVLATAERVGEMVAADGYGLITCGWPGVDHVAAQKFVETLRDRGLSEQDFLNHVVGEGRSPDYPYGNQIRVPSEQEEYRTSAALADAVILISGAGGTLKMGRVAQKMSRPVLPLAATGGDAEAMYRETLDQWEWVPVPGLSREEFNRLSGTAPAVVNDLHVLLRKLFKSSSSSRPGTVSTEGSRRNDDPGREDHRSRDLVGTKGGPMILVAGSCRNPEDPGELDTFARSCRLLGTALAEAEFSILLGSTSGRTADYFVLEGANQATHPADVLIIRPKGRAATVPLESGFSNLSVRQQLFEEGWREVRPHQVESAAAVVVIGGKGGTQEIIRLARTLGKPLLPLGVVAGAARDALPAARVSLTASGLSERTIDALEKGFDPASIVEALRSLLGMTSAEPTGGLPHAPESGPSGASRSDLLDRTKPPPATPLAASISWRLLIITYRGDEAERTAAREVVRAINTEAANWAPPAQIILHDVWKELIFDSNVQLQEYDVVIVILRSRLGTLLPSGKSSTEEEIEQVIKARAHFGRPELLMYIAEVVPASEGLGSEEMTGLFEFLARMRSSPTWSPGRAYQRYSSPDDFAKRLDVDLRRLFRDRRSAGETVREPSGSVAGPGAIFLSYRRSDYPSAARIHARLASEFGPDAILWEVDSLRAQAGAPLATQFTEVLGRCQVAVVVIGPRWATEKDDEGLPRLEDPNDWIRHGVEFVLSRGVTTIPVFVDEAVMPRRLPASLAGLAERRGVQVRPGPEFDADVERLVDSIRRSVIQRLEAPVERPRETAVAPPLLLPAYFVGRAKLLGELVQWVRDPSTSVRVRVLVGPGGVGKTALAEALRASLDKDAGISVFAWSFYSSPRVDDFLRTAGAYFGGTPSERGVDLRSPVQLLERLQRELSKAGQFLLILDGIERFQADGADGRREGEVFDAQLRDLLIWITEGRRTWSKVLVSTRVPSPHLSWLGPSSYRIHDLNGLDSADAVGLLRRHGVKGDDRRLEELAAAVDRLPRCLNFLAQLLIQFHDGEPPRGSLWDLGGTDASPHEVSLLQGVLDSFTSGMDAPRRDLITRLSVFREPARFDQLERIARADPRVAGALAGLSSSQLLALVEQACTAGLLIAENRDGATTYVVHPFVRSYLAGFMGGDPNSVLAVAGVTTSPRTGGVGADSNSLDWENVAEKYPVGTRVKGEVVDVMSSGAFVMLEEGIVGLVHISEMSWTKRINHPKEMVSVGDPIEVVVLGINREKREISLGMKHIQANPWDLVAQKYPPGTMVEGTVRNLTNYGAFIELDEGIDGLLHISDMSWTRRIGHPNEVLEKGQRITCQVLNVDQDRKRIALGLKQLKTDPWETDIPNRYQPGDTVSGKVTKRTNFGVFVELEPGLEGLLHISELADHKVDSPEEIFKVGDEIEVNILRVDRGERRIGLSRKKDHWRHPVDEDEGDTPPNLQPPSGSARPDPGPV